MTASPDLPELDPLIHESARLRIIAILNECDNADFSFLVSAAGLTRGNLSSHLARLVAAHYLDEIKEFVDRKPRSSYGLTPAGRAAYAKYLKDLKRITGWRQKG
jgi:DNA-binding transcriptional ArsR family regulator